MPDRDQLPIQFPIFLNHDHTKPVGHVEINNLTILHVLRQGVGEIVPVVGRRQVDNAIDVIAFGLVFMEAGYRNMVAEQHNEETHKAGLTEVQCGDCPHPVHLGPCVHMIKGKKCGCEYVST